MPLRLPLKAEIYVGVFVSEHVRISDLQGKARSLGRDREDNLAA